ncbi:helix-turn-helix domain-containing protein [Sphingosinicellaceae bacterium]|nr:helix-turn-helix domain-containing protein [Sphingosinicellaceae bacterium]
MRGGRNFLFPRSAVPPGIGSHVRRERVARKLSQDGLARLAGLRRETVCRIEAGRPPSSHALFAIEWALGLDSPHFVKDWKDPASPDEPSLGPRVRARRRKLGLSLQDLAAVSGVVASTISRFERELVSCAKIVTEDTDEHGLHRARILKPDLAKALGCSVAELQAYCDAIDPGPN